jgi:hypothetical protein
MPCLSEPGICLHVSGVNSVLTKNPTSMELQIDFNNMSNAEASKQAQDLQDYMTRNANKLAGPDDARLKEAKITKQDTNTQDFGATVVLILGSGAVTAIAQGIANYLSKRKQVSVRIKTAKGEVEAKNFSSKDTVEVIEKSLSSLANAN